MVAKVEAIWAKVAVPGERREQLPSVRPPLRMSFMPPLGESLRGSFKKQGVGIGWVGKMVY